MQKTPGDTPEERAAYWTSIITKARANPDGVAAYCVANNLSGYSAEVGRLYRSASAACQEADWVIPS